MMKLTAFTWVPDFARGLVREVRVRWALEEAGLPYEEMPMDMGDQNADAYRDTMQPFGQIPATEEDGLRLFESGAIVMNIAASCPALLPQDPEQRARATCWVFAALSSVEPHIQNLALIDMMYADEDWAKLRRPGAEALARARLEALERRLQGRDYLEQDFTAGDLMMTTVLRMLRGGDLLQDYPAVAAYKARCEARPAFRRALAAHEAALTGAPPASAA